MKLLLGKLSETSKEQISYMKTRLTETNQERFIEFEVKLADEEKNRTDWEFESVFA